MLTAAEELGLIIAWHHNRDFDARARLIAEFEPLVRSMAAKFAKGRRENYDDLRQEARIGLMTGIDRFDTTRGNRLSTFARFYMQERLQTYAAEVMAGVLSVPPGQATRIFMTRRSHLRDPDQLEQLARRADVTVETAADYARALSPTREESHADQACPHSIAGGIEHCQDLEMLEYGLTALSDRERQILEGRAGDKTFDKIAAEVGLSRERVRQIHAAALARLREILREPLALAA